MDTGVDTAGNDVAVGGLDGCRAGWVLVTVPVTLDAATGSGELPSFDPARVGVRMVPRLEELGDHLDSGRLAAAAIDIPVGLPSCGPRAADVEARGLLGPRRSSVFPAPARRVLGALTYEDACARSRAACGKAISRQLFNILPKIQETDAMQTLARQERLVEMCPELSLCFIAGAPMAHPKTTSEGRVERVEVLASVFGASVVALHATSPPAGARADDVLDAFAGAWTALRLAVGAQFRLGGERDERGLRMEVVA
jgi:predicted RNase H-like nuclease